MADQEKNDLVFFALTPLSCGTAPMADTKPDRFATWIALTTVIMAVFAAVATLCIRVAVPLPGCDSTVLLRGSGIGYGVSGRKENSSFVSGNRYPLLN
jgi:hypothetical protein